MEDEEIDFAAWRTFEHTGWEAVAVAYDDTLGRVTRQLVEPLLNCAKVAADHQVLDVATGPGYAAAGAGARGAHVIGIDFSERMIERAWWKYPGIEFRKGDAEHLPVSSGIFDAVVSNFGVLHFGNPDAAFAEMLRVLAPGGRLGFTTWRTDDASAGFGLIHAAIASAADADTRLFGAAYDRFTDPAEAERSLQNVGFRYVSTTPIDAVWHVRDADEVLRSLERGAVRTAALLRAQSAAQLNSIRVYLDQALASYRSAEGYALPMPATLSGATKE